MKPYEQFVANVLRAAGTAQKDPGAVSGLIQDALKTAGLMPGLPASPDATAPAASGPAAAPAAGFVDLNEAPAWARGKTAAGAATPAEPPAAAPAADAGAGFASAFGGGFTPGAGFGGMPDWAERMMAFQPGQGTSGRRDTAKEPGQFLDGSFANAAGARRYKLYVPAAPATGPRPLVVMLHGCQQNPEDFANGTTMNALAEQHNCLVLYPEQTSSGNANSCWNWFDAAHQGRGQGEPSIIADMTREVVREHGGDPARVFVAGLSAGGAMAAILGMAYPDLYKAVGVHSGLAVGSAHDLMSALNAMKGARGMGAGKKGAKLTGSVPVIVFHGDADSTVHASNGEAVLRQLSGGGSLRETEERGKDGSRSHTRTVFGDSAGRPVAEYWVLHGAGHAWSGGSTTGSYADAGGPNASGEMLRFFLAQQA